MKKIVLVALVMLVSLSSCAQKEKKTMETKSKTLVAYFSASGVTKKVAERMANISRADLYEITPEAVYTDADLDWRDNNSRSSVEMKDKSSRPAIKGRIENLSQYDTIYIGYPIWWYTCPRIINTFVEGNDLKGKTLIPFATSGSSGIEGSCKDLKEKYPDYNWKEGKLLNKATDEDIKSWMK